MGGCEGIVSILVSKMVVVAVASQLVRDAFLRLVDGGIKIRLYLTDVRCLGDYNNDAF